MQKPCAACGVILEIPTLEEAGLAPEAPAELGEPGEAVGSPMAAEPEGRVVCKRCGNFFDAVDGGRVCGACEGKYSKTFRFSRDSYEFGEVVSYAFETFQKDWLIYSLGAFIFVAISTVISGVFSGVEQYLRLSGEVELSIAVNIASQLISQFLNWIFGVGMARLALEGLQGRRPELRMIFEPLSWLMTIIFTMILTLLLMGGIGALGAAAGFGVYGATQEIGFGVLAGVAVYFPLVIYVGLPVFFGVYNELAFNPDVGPLQAIRNAFTICSGHRLMLFVFSLLFFGILLVGALACCIGFIPAFGFAQLISSCVFLTLRNGSPLEPVRREL